MRESGGALVLSATDLSNFLNCRHRTALDLGEARGRLRRPRVQDPVLEALFARGVEHERRYVSSLEQAGRRVTDLADIREPNEAVTRTVDAMRAGADAIIQGALAEGGWYGRPDVLLKVAVRSAFGDWGYEVADTKLALETKGGTILQLGLYCEMLARAQGSTPERFYVVTPDTGTAIQQYRVGDFAAYFRLIRTRLESAVAEDDEVLASANYPDPVDLCDVCPWASLCSQKRRADDHLSLVAGISRMQRRELEARNIGTLASLATLPVPLPFRPTRGSVASLERVREQARVQRVARETGQPVYELILPIETQRGLTQLPEPSRHDLFLDLEGDPFVGAGGREYLFGIVSLADDGEPVYRSFWAWNEQEERAAFDAVMALIMGACETDPGAHVYHYAPYEPSALKRLSCRHALREQDVDRLLRGGRFVDLYHVVRQGVRAGVERYSIKNLEPLYGFARSVDLHDANRALRVLEQALELHRPDVVTPEVRAAVEGYNADDCISTLRLRHWLEDRRAEALASGQEVPRRAPKEDAPPEALNERQQRVEALRAGLLEGVAADAADRTPDQWLRWRLAYLLDWHRREDKAVWWEYYRLIETPEEDLFEEPAAVAGLEFLERVELILNRRTQRPTGSVIDRYVYPVQEMEIHTGDEVKAKDGSTFGTVVGADRATRTLDVKKSKAHADSHPAALFAHSRAPIETLEASIYRVAEGFSSGTPNVLAARLLRGDGPALRSGPFVPVADRSAVDFAVQVVGDLDRSVLAIQGPPGAGKTFCGAQMICRLIAEGKRVAVAGPSHKVIRNLLDEVGRAAARAGLDARITHKVSEREDSVGEAGAVFEEQGNEAALWRLLDGSANVLGGTAWLWAREDFTNVADVLFVDEAGQMSLANVLAMAPAARSIVLLGDPQQLEQPKKGTHPEGIDTSALQHILGEHQTVPADRGIFLPVTWRLAPSVCQFTSELFYEGRLASKPGLEHQALGGSRFAGSGLWLVEVVHDGNRNASDEEVEAAARLVAELVAPGSSWIDEGGVVRQLMGKDILVVAPYNAQVSRLADRLNGTGARVGTVDKFQGQQAPVVLYSMATSRPEDAPRGLEFLYSLNRLNVATSRAQCSVIVVASPHLFTPECSTPRQMRLANALCRYRELARLVA